MLTDQAQVLLIGRMAKSPAGHLHDSGFVTVCTVENIHERAETMTPILKEIMSHCPPQRWGINE